MDKSHIEVYRGEEAYQGLFAFREKYIAYNEGGVKFMILFTILLLILLILTTITVIAISIGGSVFIILFGDIIVCIFLITWIMKKMLKKG